MVLKLNKYLKFHLKTLKSKRLTAELLSAVLLICWIPNAGMNVRPGIKGSVASVKVPAVGPKGYKIG